MPTEESLRREAWRAYSARDLRTAHGACTQWIALNPAAAEPVFVMGMIAAQMGNVRRAIELVTQAIAAQGNEAGWHAQLARLELQRHNLRAALVAARRGFALQPRDAHTLDTLGVALGRAGAHAESLDALRLAVERAPGKPAYQFNLAAAEHAAGRFEDAARAYRKVLQLDPACHKALSALAEVAPRGLVAAEASAAESALAQGHLTPDDALHLCHALAHVQEQAGNPALAMQMLARGKQRKRAALQRHADDEAPLFAAVQRVCDASFVQARAGGHDTTEPLFIIGMPRSGNALLERILASHPAVRSAGELMQFPLALKRVTRTPGPKLLDVPTLEAARACDLGELGRRYLESTRPLTGTTPHFIDRLPLNFFYAGIIRRALPRARILCLRRGAADTCLANYRHLFATNLPDHAYSLDLADTARYVAHFERLAAHWRSVMADAWLEVRYEDLVAEPDAQVRRVLKFCGLPLDPACLDAVRSASPQARTGYAESVGRWRQYRPMFDRALEQLAREGIPAD